MAYVPNWQLKRNPTEEEKNLLRDMASPNQEKASAARAQFAVAVSSPIKQGVLKGDITANIFETREFDPQTPVEYDTDFLTPTNTGEFAAFAVPHQGRIPERYLTSDYLTIRTYRVANAINWDQRYSKFARWDIVGRAMQVYEAGYVLKNNADAWHVILRAAKERNILAYDEFATAGLFTKRLVSVMEHLMRRNAGGNSTSMGRGKMTDIFVSPESHADVLSWDLTQIPEGVREQIWQNWGAGGITKVGQVLIHDLDELGVSQEFQNYMDNILGISYGSSGKSEIVVGLDLLNRDSFVNPITEKVETFEDLTLHRSARNGVYGWGNWGYACLDSRRAMVGAL